QSLDPEFSVALIMKPVKSDFRLCDIYYRSDTRCRPVFKRPGTQLEYHAGDTALLGRTVADKNTHFLGAHMARSHSRGLYFLLDQHIVCGFRDNPLSCVDSWR